MESEQTAPAIRDEVQPILGNVRFIGAIGPLFEALAKAQAEFTEMSRDAQVSFDKRTFNYATLAEVLASVRPALNKYGLALLQPFDGDKVTTILAHGSARFEVDAPLPAWADVQKLGSALTYIKRYQVKSLLGVNDGEDDDGNESVGSGKVPEPRNRPNPPAATKTAPSADAVTPQTVARVLELAKRAGFQKAELEEFSKKAGCGPLDGQTEINGLRLVVALEKLEASR